MSSASLGFGVKQTNFAAFTRFQAKRGQRNQIASIITGDPTFNGEAEDLRLTRELPILEDGSQASVSFRLGDCRLTDFRQLLAPDQYIDG